MSTKKGQCAASLALADNSDQISPNRLKAPDPRLGLKSPARSCAAPARSEVRRGLFAGIGRNPDRSFSAGA
jgi:hypothetical protein